MTAVTQRSAAQLATEITSIERELMQAHSENSQMRTKRQRLMAAGDAGAIAECNADIARTDKLIVQLTERAQDTREAVKFANARDIQAANQKSYALIQKTVSDCALHAGKLDSIIRDFGETLAALGSAKEEADSAMRRAGVEPVHDHLTAAHILNVCDMALYVASGGKFGKPVGLDSIHQLRESGRAKLAKAAIEYRELSLRHARITLRISEVQ
jgi:hypothetical protein